MYVFCFYFFYECLNLIFFFFFSSRRRHTRYIGDWSSDVCSSDLLAEHLDLHAATGGAFMMDRGSHGCLLVGRSPDELRAAAGEPIDGADLRRLEPLLDPSRTAAILVEARRIDPAAAVAAW